MIRVLPSPPTHQRQSFGGGGRSHLLTRPRRVSFGVLAVCVSKAAGDGSGGLDGVVGASMPGSVSSRVDGKVSDTVTTLVRSSLNFDAVVRLFRPECVHIHSTSVAGAPWTIRPPLLTDPPRKRW